jgi:Gpi18-like mannosyltransferase
MLHLRRTEILLFLLAVAVRLGFHFATGFVADDAFITFRYAEQLGSGHGFVYNLGEHVLGTTTPFFTFVLAVLYLLKIQAPVGSLAVSLFCSGFTAILVYRMATLLRFTRLATLPAVCYIFWPRSVVADSCGMETAFFTLLVTSAFYFQHRRLYIYALGMGTLAAVTRPEGVGLLILLLVYNLYRDRSQWWKYVITPAIIVVPWVSFATWYFGSALPNSMLAKQALYSQFGGMSIWQRLVQLMGWNSPAGVVLVPLVMAGAWWLWRKQAFGRLELVWLVGMCGFFTFGPARLFFWYVAPIYPILLLFATAAAVPGIEQIERRRRERWGSGVLVAVAAMVLIVACYKPYKSFGAQQETQDAVHRAIGEYLRGEAGRDDVVAAEDIGYMGYYSRLRVIDRDGLVSPEVIPYNRSGQYRQVIAAFKPDWVVLYRQSPMSQFTADSVFTATYHEATSFAHAGIEYAVYRRIAAE